MWKERVVWNSFRNIKETDVPLLPLGGFNIILNSEDKKGGVEFELKGGILELRECVDDYGLIGMGFTGQPCAWCNDQQVRRRVVSVQMIGGCALRVQALITHHVQARAIATHGRTGKKKSFLVGKVLVEQAWY